MRVAGGGQMFYFRSHAKRRRAALTVRQTFDASRTGRPPVWPRPPRCLTALQLELPPDGARVAVAGIVVCRQRPGTAKGVIFLTLEDETGTANIVVWAKVFERFRRAVIAGRCLRITGRLQRDGDVIHLVAENIEDISALLDEIVGIDVVAEGQPDPAKG